MEVGYPPRTPAQARVCTAPGDVPAPCPRSPRGYRSMVRVAIGSAIHHFSLFHSRPRQPRECDRTKARRNDGATLTMEKKKDAAAPHAPRMADMVRHCHRMAAVRGGGHMRRYVTTGRHGPGCQRQPRGKNGAPPAPFFRKYGARVHTAFSHWRYLTAPVNPLSLRAHPIKKANEIPREKTMNKS